MTSQLFYRNDVNIAGCKTKRADRSLELSFCLTRGLVCLGKNRDSFKVDDDFVSVSGMS